MKRSVMAKQNSLGDVGLGLEVTSQSDKWKITQDISTMTSHAPIHKSAFRAAFQANLLKEHCDKPQHKILKDFLLALEKMTIKESENEEGEMDDDSRNVEEGECLTTDYESDASAFSNASTSAAKKKKAILMLPNVDLDDDLKAEVMEVNEEFDLRSLFKHDYYLNTYTTGLNQIFEWICKC